MKALVLCGDGINCEKETAAVCGEVGFKTQIQHVNDLLLEKGASLAQSQILVLPGGFSFGDELGSGKILALKLKFGLGKVLDEFILNGGLVLGICNGFQVLTQLGVFGEGIVLTRNKSGRFQNRWVQMKVVGHSIYTQGITDLELPIRHGEGRLLFTNEENAWSQMNSKRCVLRYTEDVNGSWNQIAALSAHEGRVLGIMPHPEAFWCLELHPEKKDTVPLGTVLFKNAFEYIRARGSK